MSLIEGIHFSLLRANGMSFRLASPVRNLGQNGAAMARSQGRPLVLFLHGFPESWYSWRHQLRFLQDQPFLAVAPDMRGYGSTSQPNSVEDYTKTVLAKDVREIARGLGYDEFFVVGHDWGCIVAWSVALLYPENVLGVCGLSVPYSGTPKKGMLSTLQDMYGHCLDPSLPREVREKAKFNYFLHHCLPYSAELYEENVEEFLYRCFAVRPYCEKEEGTPEYDLDGLMFLPSGDEEYDRTRPLDAKAAPGWWLRWPRPKTLPEWLTREDLDYFIGEFKRSGFHGALRWYQAEDLNFHQMKDALRKPDGSGYRDKITPPSMFMMGQWDPVIRMFGGTAGVEASMAANLPNLTGPPVFVDKCGHWIQQENPDVVNAALLPFLNSIASDGGHSRL